MNPTLILKLSESADQPLSLVGGKAKNLMRLAGTGITVPPGFCITTEAYREFVARNGLGRLIRETLETIPENDKPARLEAAKRIGEQFRNGIFPSELSDSIRSHFDDLAAASGGALRVAVRSSATAEDLAEASFAGVQKTVLNVRGFAQVLEQLRECWASLWCESVISYRARMGLAGDDLAIAVIVQRMIPSHVSGVLFTVEPVTGDPGRLTVEACWGLGEALVSGNITPDHYEMDRASFRVRKQIYGRQLHAIESSETGGTRLIPVPGPMRKRSCLATEQLTELARTGLAIERHFGSPQDIEWAIDSPSGESEPATIYFLQSRPITVIRPQSTGFAQTEPWESPVPGAIWVRQSGGIVEHFSTPASPLFATAQLPLICELLDAQCPEMGVVTPRPTYALINGYFYNRSDYRLGPRALSLPVNYWRAARKGARHWRTHVLPKQSAALAAAEQFNLAAARSAELLGYLQTLFAMNAEAWDQAVRASRTYVFTEPLFHRLFDRFIRPIAGGEAVVFLRGFESQVMAGEHMQWKLARAARSLPKVSSRIQTYKPEEAWRRIEADPACRSWAKQLSAFCRSHGHLNASLDYLHETMADDPAKAIQSIRLRIESEGEDPLCRHAQLTSEREKATAQAREKLQRHPLRKALFEWALAWAQEGASTRENIFFFALRGWPLARRALLRLGTILVETGTLNRREDVFFLNWEEVQQALTDGTPTNWQAIVAERRAAQEHRSTLNPPARIPEEGAPVTFRRKVTAALKQCILGRNKQVDQGVLWGAPVSPGVVTGPAQIICSVEEVSRLKPGNILVTRAATPEWTSTFTIAAGLITDVGGPLSHSSIIAREFGLPTVMGVRTATTAISEGQLITIDGAKGFIQLH